MPQFDVTLGKPTYKVGEEVLFKFSGDADMITFYSGLPANDYAFKEGREVVVENQGVDLEFQSAVSGGAQTNQLSVMVSTDFDGNYDDFNSVKKAAWTNLTSQFLLGTNTTFRASGTKEITNLVVPGKPIYIAFKYVTKPQQANGVVRQWWIQSFLVKSKATFNGVPVTITNQRAAGFKIVDENKVNAPARSTITSARVTLWGNFYRNPEDPIFDPENPVYDKLSANYDRTAVYVPFDETSPYNDFPSEHWAISLPIHVNKVDLGPDRSVAIKGMDTQPPFYSFAYSTPGTYKVYFTATNANIKNSKTYIKSVDVTIEP
jgi:hypothetical protein